MKKEERKQRILDDFYLLKGNHETRKINALYDKARKFQSDEEEEMRDKITGEIPLDYDVVAEGDQQIRDILAVLYIWKDEASISEDVEERFKKRRSHVGVASNILNRIEAQEDWDYYDVAMATYLFSYADTFEKSCDLAEKILKKSEDFFDSEHYSAIKVSVHTDMMLRLIYAKFDEVYEEEEEEFEVLEQAFKTHHDALLEICNTDVNRFYLHKVFATFRNIVFSASNKVFYKNPESIAYEGKTTETIELLRVLKAEMEGCDYLARQQANIPEED